jgi:trimeric autotransporter adhesin
MSRATILTLSLVAFALSSGALAQGGGAGGGGSGAGGASGASGTRGNSSGSMSPPSGNSVAQPSGGQSSPTGNTAAQSPGSTGQNSINSPGTGVGPGSTPGSTSTRPLNLPARLLQRTSAMEGNGTVRRGCSSLAPRARAEPFDTARASHRRLFSPKPRRSGAKFRHLPAARPSPE